MNRKEQISNANPYAGSSDIGFGKMVGFTAGAEWADKHPASPWIRTEDRLPENEEPVLTSSSIYGTPVLVWNAPHALWFHEGGEDAYCERDKIDDWMPIPE